LQDLLEEGKNNKKAIEKLEKIAYGKGKKSSLMFQTKAKRKKIKSRRKSIDQTRHNMTLSLESESRLQKSKSSLGLKSRRTKTQISCYL
jgi:hypothetical protein